MADRHLPVEHVEYVEFSTEEAPTRPSTPLGFTRADEVQLGGVFCSSTLPNKARDVRTVTGQLLIQDTSSSSEDSNHQLGTHSASMSTISLKNPESIDTIPGLPHSQPNLAGSHGSCGSTLSSSDDEDVDSEEFESDCSSCDSSDEELGSTTLPSPPMTPPPSPPRSVSRLSFPFCKPKLRPRVSIPPTPRRSPPPPLPPLAVKKFSCLPSPLSPNRTLNQPDCPPATPTRHNYEEHGYSRHAFLNLKWFWSTREDEWDVKSSATVDTSPRLGETSGISRLGKLGPAIRLSKKTRLRMDVEDALPPPTIHPRRGDISALRDPWCANVDRCFVDLPVWTISKTLWMYDLHAEADRRARAEEAEGEDDTESEADTSMSTGCSDDSDVTLVGSESESDLKRFSNRIHSSESIKDNLYEHNIIASPSGRSVSSSPSLSAVSLVHKHPVSTVNSASDVCRSLPSITSSSPLSFRPHGPRWITDWYSRWELIIELTRRDKERKHAEHMAHHFQGPDSTTSKSSRFFFADSRDGSENDFCD